MSSRRLSNSPSCPKATRRLTVENSGPGSSSEKETSRQQLPTHTDKLRKYMTNTFGVGPYLEKHD